MPSLLSQDKLEEVWEDLWERWGRAVAEVGEEEGRYAVQDVHWEAPYFDSSLVSEEIKEVAAQMLPYQTLQQPGTAYGGMSEDVLMEPGEKISTSEDHSGLHSLQGTLVYFFVSSRAVTDR